MTDEQKKAEELMVKFDSNFNTIEQRKEACLICIDEMESVHKSQLRYMTGWMGGITHSREVLKYYNKLREAIKDYDNK